MDNQQTIDTYLAAYGEPDADRRAALVGEVFADDADMIDPPLDARGHADIVSMFGTVQEHYPGHTFRRTTTVDVHHGRGRYSWVMVAGDGSTSLQGTDVVTFADDGRIREVVGFFDPATGVDTET